MTNDSPKSRDIASVISTKRKEAGITAKELAERSNLSPAYISRVESGDFQSLTLPTVRALAEGLGITLRMLLEDLGMLNNEDRPSYKLISQSLRHMGFSDKDAEDVIRYARFLNPKVDDHR